MYSEFGLVKCCERVGRMILSGGSGGLVAVSSRTTGMTVRVINDQQGAPVTSIDVQPLPVCTLSRFYLLLATTSS